MACARGVPQLTKDVVGLNCREIDRCNQRGGRMLSVVDLLEAGTLDRDLAAYLLAAIGNGSSFMVGAVPGGAGKTTVMGALLNLVPAQVALAPADCLETVRGGLGRPEPRTCFICHEIGRGGYYAYLWDEALRAFFELPAAGHSMATNLHADDLEQAHDQICRQCRVPEKRFRGMNLVLFLSLAGGTRVITDVRESDGSSAHVSIYSKGKLKGSAIRLTNPGRMEEARVALDGLVSSGARTISQVRTFLLKEFLSTSPR